MAVFVLDKHKKPLMPCSEKRAKALLTKGIARIHKYQPFTIRLTHRLVENSELQDVSIKLDPGFKTTGIAVVRHSDKSANILNLINLAHRKNEIRDSLISRAALRRGRRSRKTWYREPRFNNRGGDKTGWLPPSLRHLVESSVNFTNKLRKLAPVTGLAVERVKFDTQLMDNPEISGVEYQQGALKGYEVREYLLEKYAHSCAYCGAKDTRLEIEHMQPRAKGGSDSVKNLAIACTKCNQRKGTKSLEEFLKNDKVKIAKVRRGNQNYTGQMAAAAVNSTREALFTALLKTGLPVETGTGGQTKYNRMRFGLEKDHCIDAACVGDVGEVTGADKAVLHVKVTGRGKYCRTRTDKYGFPIAYAARDKLKFGFQTGDLVKVHKKASRKWPEHTRICRVTTSADGGFYTRLEPIEVAKLQTKVITFRPGDCIKLQHNDGYAYSVTGPLTCRKDNGTNNT